MFVTAMGADAAVAVVAVCDAAHPGDTEQLERWLVENPQAEVVCVLGKTEGNGCVNDFTRGFATMAITRALERTNRLPKGKEPPAIIMSGGTEGAFIRTRTGTPSNYGFQKKTDIFVLFFFRSPSCLNAYTGVLCPHFIVFANSTAPGDAAPDPDPDEPRLAVGVARTRDFLPEEIGRSEMATATSAAVLEACDAANIPLGQLCFVQIKCPLLTPARVAAAASACATEDCYHSMALSRGASSLGVALATGEISSVADTDVCRDFSKSSSVASSSAGIELMHCEVMVLGNAPGSRSKLRGEARAGECISSCIMHAITRTNPTNPTKELFPLGERLYAHTQL